MQSRISLVVIFDRGLRLGDRLTLDGRAIALNLKAKSVADFEQNGDRFHV